ncbi:hypothetical protein [Bifidobacterium pseudocatenulatum]|uniref:hypothetical protein n=1 Tax=Bifidobacterium pseudocatenulatum TaxID=28026 RepID=UPI001CFD7731|nr:hypothetical protein [Bifidobacterium pseudocatenulatum]MCB4898744.1 hypothetical protein [Bifidobacterium pseudocatenulatum]
MRTMFDVISLLVRLARLLAGFLERPGRGRHARIPVRPVWAGLLLDWLAAVLDWLAAVLDWLERLVG